MGRTAAARSHQTGLMRRSVCKVRLSDLREFADAICSRWEEQGDNTCALLHQVQRCPKTEFERDGERLRNCYNNLETREYEGREGAVDARSSARNHSGRKLR